MSKRKMETLYQKALGKILYRSRHDLPINLGHNQEKEMLNRANQQMFESDIGFYEGQLIHHQKSGLISARKISMEILGGLITKRTRAQKL